jgi:hypothetical protein
LLLTSLAAVAACSGGCNKKHDSKFWGSLTPEQKECVHKQKKATCPDAEHGTKKMKECKKQALKACGVKLPEKKKDKNDGKLADNMKEPAYEELDIYEWED